MIIDYLGHSGFLVETEQQLLLFDYYRGDLSLLDNNLSDKPLFVFVSHAHPDHFNPEIFSLAGQGRQVKYLLSFDLQGHPAIPQDTDVSYLDTDQDYVVPGLGIVQTLRSTDEGVAFLTRTGTETVFHAGDLHWWDWPGEDPDWLSEQKQVFQAEVGKLAGVRLDAAFLVLDDRLEENYAEGMAWFLSVCAPKYALPMHFWKDRDIVDRYLSCYAGASPDTQILNTAKQTHWEIP